MVQNLNLFIDTSVLLSALVDNDTNHELALDIFRLRKTHNFKICINSIVLSELLIVLKRKGFDNKKVSDFYNNLINSGEVVVLNVDGSQLVSSVLQISNLNINLKSNDFLVSSAAVHFGALFVTFDTRIYKNIKPIYDKTFSNKSEILNFLNT